MASLSKITAPSPYGIIPRERVFRLLDESLKKSVTWVAGPAGSGKTSLVSSYLVARGLPHLWYSVDAGDADISAFFYYMGLGAKKAAPRFTKPLPLLTPEYILGIPVFTQRYFEELYRRLKPPHVIVLDNYQEVPAQSRFHEVVSIALTSAPEGIRVIVLSRNAAPRTLVRLRANSRISLLGWKDLRLTPDETREIVRGKVEKKLKRETLFFLHKKTAGWVAGLILFIENLKLQGFDYRIPDGLPPEEVFHYFANEIFQKADPDMQAFLLKSAFLPSMTVPMAEGLTGIRAAGRILDNLTESHYFTERRPDEHSAYLYHPLFREFLLSRAQDAFAPEEMTGIRQKAAGLLIDSGRVDDAAALLIQAQDWKRFVPLVLDRAPSLMAQGRGETLCGWIGKLPEEILKHNPWLLFWNGICTLPFAPGESRKLLEQAFHLFEAQGVRSGMLLAWSGAVQTFLFEFHDFKPLDPWTDWLDAHMGPEADFPSADIKVSVAAGMVGALAWRRPNHPAMREWVNTALSLAQETPNVDIALRAYTNCALYFLWMGEFTECGSLIEDMRRLARSGSTSPSRLISLKIAEAMYYNSLAEFREKAIQAVLDGMETAERTGVHVFDPILLVQGVYSSLNDGDLRKTKGYLSRMEVLLGNRNTNTSYFYYFSAWYHLLAGDIAQAALAAGKSLHHIERAGVPVSEALIRLILAQILQEKGDGEEAYRQLRIAGGIAKETESPYLKYLRCLIEAHFAFSSKHEKAGLQALREGMTLARQMGFVTFIHLWRPNLMSALCVKALEAGFEVEHVRNLVEKLRLVPDVPPIEVETWPWAVKIHTLGRFALITHGEPAKEFSKARKKPLLLLKAVIALGGRDVKEERLIDILWPDAEGDAGHHAFTTTLARLRGMLGDDRTVHFHNGRVSLDNRLCWIDSWVFEKLCSQAEGFLQKPPDGKADLTALKAIVGKAMGLYAGHFLHSDSDELWTVTARERLRNKYLRLLSVTAEFYVQIGDLEEAARTYQRGLESDPLAEEFYQGLLVSYLRLGRHGEALTVYRQCRKILQAELGISPSPKTESLRSQIPGIAK